MSINETINTEVPEGYKMDAKGRLVPLSMISEIDQARDQLVQDIVGKARQVSTQLGEFKTEAFGDIQAFIQMSAEEYGAKVGGDKGNVSLISFDGRYKVQRAIQESLSFNERLQAAKAKIDTCLERWSEGAQPELKVLIKDAFQVDQEGNINTGRVLSLRRLKITDPDWQDAMQAIGDALQVTGSKSYVRVYERIGNSNQYRAIALDIAAV